MDGVCLDSDGFKSSFHSLSRGDRAGLLRVAVESLSKAEVDCLLGCLDRITVFPSSELQSRAPPSQPSLGLTQLTQLFHSLHIEQKLLLLTDLVGRMPSCDTEDLVDIVDSRLDDLNCSDRTGVAGAESDDELEDEDDEEEDLSSDDVVFVDPSISLSDDNCDQDLDSSNTVSEFGDQAALASRFLQSSFQTEDEDGDESKFCNICDKFVRKKGWYKHMNTVHSTQRFSCTLCPNSRFKAKKYWKAHMRNIHKDLNIQFPDGRTAGASTLGLLGPGLHCGDCGAAFVSAELLKQHSDSVHRSGAGEGDEDYEEICEIPGGEAGAGAGMCGPGEAGAGEEKTAKGDEFSQCPYCLIMTKSLRNHIKFVHMKKFQCELCQKTFSANAKLTRHLESHLRGTNRIHHPGTVQLAHTPDPALILPKDRPKNITCQLCGYKCVSTWKLKRHMNAHQKGTNRFSLH